MITPIKKEATIATIRVESDTGGIAKPLISTPGKKYGASLNWGRIEVRAYNAMTFVSQAKKPSVKRLSGKSSILIRGTSKKFIKVKTRAPIKSDFSPPA